MSKNWSLHYFKLLSKASNYHISNRMGGQLIKGYQLQGEALANVGTTKSWKLYQGKKQDTQQPVSIFLIEKKHIKKSEREEIIKIAKREASHLARIRHPGVLGLVEPLTEDEHILAYVTQKIEGNLSNLIKGDKLQEFIASELELKLSLYPFLETMVFLQENVKLAHLAISLQNIYLTVEGKWKLSGFTNNASITGDAFQENQDKIFDFSFCSPEFALNKKFNRHSDTFSIGVLIVRLLEAIRKQYKFVQIPSKSEYQKSMNGLKSLSKQKCIQVSENSNDLKDLLRKMVEWESSERISLCDILCSKWMNDKTVLTVKYLDKMSNYESKQQLQFLKGLAGVIDDFEKRLLLKVIIPKLIDLLKFNHLIASIIYIILDIIKKNKLTIEAFRKIIWPHLKTVTQGKEMTAQAIYLLVLNMDILQKYIGDADTMACVMPLYLKCYDCPLKLKHLALSQLERIVKKVDYQYTKTKIIPKLLTTMKDANIQTRKESFKGLYSIMHTIDSQTMSSNILPGMQQARKLGSDNFINAISNHIYIILANTLSTEIISTKILPILISYLSDTSLTQQQFSSYKNTVFIMIGKIEKEREKNYNGQNNLVENVTFQEEDFKFKSMDDQKVVSSPSNYEFLQNYIQSKKQTTNIVSSPAQQNTSEQTSNEITYQQPTYNNNNLSMNQQQQDSTRQQQKGSSLNNKSEGGNPISNQNLGHSLEGNYFAAFNGLSPSFGMPPALNSSSNSKNGSNGDTVSQQRYKGPTVLPSNYHLPQQSSHLSISPSSMPNQLAYQPPSLDFGQFQKPANHTNNSTIHTFSNANPNSPTKKFVGPSNQIKKQQPFNKKQQPFNKKQQSSNKANLNTKASNNLSQNVTKTNAPNANMNFDYLSTTSNVAANTKNQFLSYDFSPINPLESTSNINQNSKVSSFSQDYETKYTTPVIKKPIKIIAKPNYEAPNQPKPSFNSNVHDNTQIPKAANPFAELEEEEDQYKSTILELQKKKSIQNQNVVSNVISSEMYNYFEDGNNSNENKSQLGKTANEAFDLI